MDKRISSYIESRVLEILNSDKFTNLSDSEKKEKAAEIFGGI